MKYKSYFHILHAKVSKTQLERMHDENSPLVNFEKLRDSGWIKSTVNEIEVIYATEDKSLVRLNFSRINKEQEVIVTKDGFYPFTKINGKLGIEVLFDGSKRFTLKLNVKAEGVNTSLNLAVDYPEIPVLLRKKTRRQDKVQN